VRSNTSHSRFRNKETNAICPKWKAKASSFTPKMRASTSTCPLPNTLQKRLSGSTVLARTYPRYQPLSVSLANSGSPIVSQVKAQAEALWSENLLCQRVWHRCAWMIRPPKYLWSIQRTLTSWIYILPLRQSSRSIWDLLWVWWTFYPWIWIHLMAFRTCQTASLSSSHSWANIKSRLRRSRHAWACFSRWRRTSRRYTTISHTACSASTTSRTSLITSKKWWRSLTCSKLIIRATSARPQTPILDLSQWLPSCKSSCKR